MWFHLGIQNFIAKKIIYDGSYELYISDFIRIWHTSVTNEEVVSVSQKLNPLIEAPVQKLKEIISNLLKCEKAEKTITEENNTITLKLKSTSLEVKFLFQFDLYHKNEEFFYKEFTLPLLLVFIELQNREKKLMKIITDKDEEIREYKQECGMIKANYVATKPFNEEEFDSQESVMNICDINSFLECISSVLPIAKKEQSLSENLSDKSLPDTSQKFITDTNKAIFRDANSKNGPYRCVKLQHKTIKRIKKKNDELKIRF